MFGFIVAVQVAVRQVDIGAGESKITGIVEAVTREKDPMIQVNGQFYRWEDVTTVYGK